MSSFGSFNLRAFIDDKKRIIGRRLSKLPPTVVVSLENGMYVFAPRVAKVHSTIILAGAGNMFPAIETWFREQINNLILHWSVNVPAAESEINLLPPIFSENLHASRNIVEADLVVVEIKKDRHSDFIARVDSQGNISRADEGTSVYTVSYKNPPEDTDEHEEAAKNGDELRLRLEEEFAALGISRPEAIWGESAAAELAEELRRHYPGEKCFLNRKKFVEKNYNWVYETL
jgi:hypothetical protein